MNILALETSTKRLSVAVSKRGKITASRTRQAQRKLSAIILPTIEEILCKGGLSLQKVDCLAIGLGPGSFTGLRVGLATVKGIAFGLNKGVVGVPTLDILAANIKETDAMICPVVDARRGLVYAGFYRYNKGKLKRLFPSQLCDIASVVQRCQGKTVFVGDAIALYRDEIKKITQEQKIVLEPILAKKKDWYPKAEELIYLAEEKIQRKGFDNSECLNPLYFYSADCQVRQKQKKRL